MKSRPTLRTRLESVISLSPVSLWLLYTFWPLTYFSTGVSPLTCCWKVLSALDDLKKKKKKHYRKVQCPAANFLIPLLLSFPSSLLTEVLCVTFCSPAVRTACAGSGQRRCCLVTASCPVTITTTTVVNTVTRSDVRALLRKTTAMGRRKEEQHRK